MHKKKCLHDKLYLNPRTKIYCSLYVFRSVSCICFVFKDFFSLFLPGDPASNKLPLLGWQPSLAIQDGRTVLSLFAACSTFGPQKWLLLNIARGCSVVHKIYPCDTAFYWDFTGSIKDTGFLEGSPSTPFTESVFRPWKKRKQMQSPHWRTVKLQYI